MEKKPMRPSIKWGLRVSSVIFAVYLAFGALAAILSGEVLNFLLFSLSSLFSGVILGLLTTGIYEAVIYLRRNPA